MSEPLLPPPLSPPESVATDLRQRGFAVLDTAAVQALSGVGPDAFAEWHADWDLLPPDHYLRDGGRYRRRRHGCFVVRGESVQAVPHRAHWQPVEYNALHGGIERWFEPMLASTSGRPDWLALLAWLGRVASALRGDQPWFVEAHQFRIDTEGGIGRPTPEGAHRDGVDLVAVFLMARVGIKGGETRVFDANGPTGQRFTLTQPGSLLLLDDLRVIHESTPIQPLNPADGGHRDTLVLTVRSQGFQAAANP